MRAMVIYNAAAGQRDFHAAVQLAAAYLRDLGWDVLVRATERRNDATLFARQAAEAGLDVVFTAGGDGTINETINGLAYSQVALGVIPVGTANVWAQEIGLPLPFVLGTDPGPLLDGARLLSEGVIRTMDLGKAGDRYFMLYASVGFDADIVRSMETQTDLKAQLGGWAYYLAGAAAAWRFRGINASLRINGKRIRRHIWAVMAANTQLYGGVMRIAADAYADDGMLDIVVVEGHGPLATLRHYAGFILRGLWADPQVEVYRSDSVEIQTRDPMPIQLDGDLAGTTPVTFSIAPQALRVLVPRSAPQRIFSRDNPIKANSGR
jgi:YegS/Rv2252/BmrU family lipid kinase